MKKRKTTDALPLLLAAALILALGAFAVYAVFRDADMETRIFEGPEDYVSPTTPPPGTNQ